MTPRHPLASARGRSAVTNSESGCHRGAGPGSRVRDAISGQFLKRGTEKRRPRPRSSSSSSARSSRGRAYWTNPATSQGASVLASIGAAVS